MYDDHNYAIEAYKNLIKHKADYSLCTDCVICEGTCPQNLEIRQYLKGNPPQILSLDKAPNLSGAFRAIHIFQVPLMPSVLDTHIPQAVLF